MPWLCRDCTNKDDFVGQSSGTCYYTESGIFNRDGCIEDLHDTNYDDYETMETTIQKCNECSSENIEDVSVDEWNDWKGPDQDIRRDNPVKKKDETWSDYYKRKEE